MVSVTIPVYNEQDNIERLSQKLSAALDDMGREWEVIFINDGSSDNSSDRIDEICGKDTRFKAIHLEANCGQTAAMMAGFDYAKGDIIIPMDADLQNDPDDIKKLLEKMEEGYDVVSGWRKKRKDNIFLRNIPSAAANRIISMISGVKLHDFGCTMKAYKRDVIKNVKLYGEMHRFIPVYASWHGAKITEIPVTHHKREHGKSKYGIGRVFKVLLDLVVIIFLKKYSQKPMHFFGGFAFYNFLVSFLCFGLMLYFKFWGGKSFIRTPLPFLVIAFALIGVFSIFFGLLGEIQNRTYHESQDKRIYGVKEKVNL